MASNRNFVILGIAYFALAAWPASSLAGRRSSPSVESECISYALRAALRPAKLSVSEIPLAVAVQTLEANGYPVDQKLFQYGRTKFRDANPIVASALHEEGANLHTLYVALDMKYGSLRKALDRLNAVKIPRQLLELTEGSQTTSEALAARSVSKAMAESEPEVKSATPHVPSRIDPSLKIHTNQEQGRALRIEDALRPAGLGSDEIPLAIAVQMLQANGYPVNPKLFKYAGTKFRQANSVVSFALHDRHANLDTLYSSLLKRYRSVPRAEARLTAAPIPSELLEMPPEATLKPSSASVKLSHSPELLNRYNPHARHPESQRAETPIAFLEMPNATTLERERAQKIAEVLSPSGLKAYEIPLAVAVQTLEANGYPVERTLFRYGGTQYAGASSLLSSAFRDANANLDSFYDSLIRTYGSIPKARARLTEVAIPRELIDVRAEEPKVLELQSTASDRESQLWAPEDIRAKEKTAEREPVPQTTRVAPRNLEISSRTEKAHKPSAATKNIVRSKHPEKDPMHEARLNLLRNSVGNLMVSHARNFEPTAWNLLKKSDTRSISKILQIVKEDYGGSLYKAYQAAGFDAEKIFQRPPTQFVKPYSISDLALGLRAIGDTGSGSSVGMEIHSAVALEAPTGSRDLRLRIVQHLIEDHDLDAEDVGRLSSQLAARISTERSRQGGLLNRVDPSQVLTELRILARNRSVLDSLGVPTRRFYSDSD